MSSSEIMGTATELISLVIGTGYDIGKMLRSLQVTQDRRTSLTWKQTTAAVVATRLWYRRVSCTELTDSRGWWEAEVRVTLFGIKLSSSLHGLHQR